MPSLASSVTTNGVVPQAAARIEKQAEARRMVFTVGKKLPAEIPTSLDLCETQVEWIVVQLGREIQ
jgi:hypothetical protein